MFLYSKSPYLISAETKIIIIDALTEPLILTYFLVGVRVAYRAFQQALKQANNSALIKDSSLNFTADQQFFVSFATVRCFWGLFLD
jgi:hypothetical protein